MSDRTITLFESQRKMDTIKRSVKLSKLSVPELRKLNEYPAYNGKELTKYQLIYQIIYNQDCPKIK